ncbi:MAG: 3-phosphoshikimate 1-carboxyvinyltransferase [Pseudomonadales bacterium]|nr:3-phosphoshikimate 1-carboxyvinyltransferase [Pseudomonadales bacterium]
MAKFKIPRIAKPFAIDVMLPGSKSIALRQLAMSALTDKPTTLFGIPHCDDTEAMLDSLTRLGMTISRDKDQTGLQGPMNLTDDVTLDARMSGASTRLLIGLAALRSGQTCIDGHESLRARTNTPLVDALERHGCQVNPAPNGGLPLRIKGPIASTSTISIDGSLSSQYITALLVIMPLLKDANRIEITGDLVSKPYIDITLNEMSKRGVNANWCDANTLEVTPGDYGGGEFRVEGDATAATYFAGLATLHQSSVHLLNIGAGTHQGDYKFMKLMEDLGAHVSRTSETTKITGPKDLAELGSIDMTEMPDAALTLIAMLPMLPGIKSINGLSSLHHKECDRLECPAQEFKEMGVGVDTTEDSITIGSVLTGDISAHELTTYHDHRIAMAFSLLGSCTDSLTVDDKRVVDKTYPEYWSDYQRAVAT